jgi:hypothetical protein
MIRYRWRTELKRVTTEAQVLEVVRRYLETYSSEELASLPEGAHPPGIVGWKDVTIHTFKLGEAHARYEGHSHALPLLQELLLFFTHASVRLTQLRAGDRTLSPASHGTARGTLTEAESNLFEAPKPSSVQRAGKPVTDGQE